eukprot:m.4451 g.4451  ORF g.4451 m.4451 type:complete len:202 (+) comp2988_c0_seq1:251-856(+)
MAVGSTRIQEFEAENRLSDADELRDHYIGVLDNVAVVTALISGFTLSFAVSNLEINDSIVDINLWENDDHGREAWKCMLALTSILAFATCVTAVNMSQQIAQCPSAIFKKYFAAIGPSKSALPFILLGICYFMFFVCMGILFSLILRTALFAVCISVLLFVVLLVASRSLVPLATLRVKLMVREVNAEEHTSATEMEPKVM